MDMDTVMDITAMVIMVTMEREKLRPKLLLSQDTAIMVMDMVMVMDMDTAMDIMVTMEREKLRLKQLLSQDTAIMVMVMDMDTVMDITAMVIMVTMERERLRQNQDTDIMDIMDTVMVMDMVMAMGTMDNIENQIFVLCRKLSMDELVQLDLNLNKSLLKKK